MPETRIEKTRRAIDYWINRQGLVLLDGALATCLEERGHSLHETLWSADMLASDPDAIFDLHMDYLRAGANCIITASYQASLPGFVQAGFDQDTAIRLMRTATRLGIDARRAFVDEGGDENTLVAVSLGPYGASLADGSEYHGGYSVSEHDLVQFHQQRLRLFVDQAADIFAFETIPNATEAQVAMQLMAEYPGQAFWLSFSCRDDHRISDGTSITDFLSGRPRPDNLVALGINCTAPEHIESLVKRIRWSCPDLHVVVYPNRGDEWDADARCWKVRPDGPSIHALACDWQAAGADMIGGCCRTTPADVAALKRIFVR